MINHATTNEKTDKAILMWDKTFKSRSITRDKEGIL